MAKVYVGGPSGSGKTTVCRVVAQNLGIKFLTGSEIMMDVAGVATREDLSKLPEDEKNYLRLNAFEFYYQATQDMIIDGHFYLTERDIAYLDCYVLVETDTERLIKLRKGDEIRRRTIEPSAIEAEISELHDRICKLESKFGIRVTRIKNDSTLDELGRNVEGIYMSVNSNETQSELRGWRKERL